MEQVAGWSRKKNIVARWPVRLALRPGDLFSRGMPIQKVCFVVKCNAGDWVHFLIPGFVFVFDGHNNDRTSGLNNGR